MSQDDIATRRYANALALFDEFVTQTVKHPDAATLRGLERRFAERLAIQPSYWSQIKSRSRQIGERLARQFEQRCHKPPGWLDLPHPASAGIGYAASAGIAHTAAPAATPAPELPASQPQDDDERFIVGLVLTYYRRHPQRARERLLGLLGEVLTPSAPAAPKPAVPPAPSMRSPHDEWLQSQRGVAPLKRKR